MTLPDERTRAVNDTRQFLRDLLVPQTTPKGPLWLRKRAHMLLKHYPSDFDIYFVAGYCPYIFERKRK